MRVIYALEAIRDLKALKEFVVEKFADAKLTDDVVHDIMKKREKFRNVSP